MKPKAKKRTEVEQLRSRLETTRNVFVSSFQGIKVKEDFELRKQVRAAGGHYRVVANRLARVASQGTAAEPLLKDLKGMTSLAFAGKDPVVLAKALTAYAKNHPVYSFRAGLVEGKVVDVRALAELANLPAREVVYAKLLFMIQAGAQRLVASIGGVSRNLAVVLNQGVQQNKFNE